MRLVIGTLTLGLMVGLAAAVPLADPQGSHGSSGSSIVFGDTVEGDTLGNRFQSGETSATSVQNTTGDGQQTNRGEATAVSVQKQTGLGGATQSTLNQGAVQALQGAGGGGGGDGGDGGSGGSSGGGGGGQQVSNNQVNIVSNQQQQNVEGTLINVQGGNQGVVVVNKRKPGSSGSVRGLPRAPSFDDRNTLLQITDDDEVVLVITANKTEEVEVVEPVGPSCRYFCIRPTNNEPYCCDDGSNRGGDPEIHGGKCPRLRLLCTRNSFFNKCAHDGQCPASDKCCFDTCLDMHICKRADRIR